MVSRFHKKQTVSVTTSATTTEQVNFKDVAGGQVRIPAGSSITPLTFYASEEEGGTFAALYDDTPTTPVAIALTGLGASKVYVIPAKVFGAGAIRMVGDAAGDVHLSLKG